MNKYEVTANGIVFGVYEANTEEEARNLCAQDAGYDNETDMELQLGQGSQLEARKIKENE